MILADKIINERKKNGWSQEELASKLSVSRQSVSKWEGAQAVPDLQKIIAMAEIFGVSTDYLLKDEIEAEVPKTTTDIVVTSSENEPPVKSVSLEEANEFLNDSKKNTPALANAVSMCIMSPIVLIFMAGLSEYGKLNISENMAAGIGLVPLFLLITIAVYIFIVIGSKMDKYEFLKYEPIDTAYGVSGMVKEKRDAYNEKHIQLTAAGVIMCVVSAVPLIIAGLAELGDFISICMFCVLLAVISIAVNMFIRSGGTIESYDMLLQINEFTVGKKKHKKTIERVSSIYWSIAAAIYLGISFYTNAWERTWIVWPVAGVLYVIVKKITILVLKAED